MCCRRLATVGAVLCSAVTVAAVSSYGTEETENYFAIAQELINTCNTKLQTLELLYTKMASNRSTVATKVGIAPGHNRPISFAGCKLCYLCLYCWTEAPTATARTTASFTNMIAENISSDSKRYQQLT